MFMKHKPTDELLAMPNIKRVVDMQVCIHRRHYLLHMLGLNNREIANLTGSTINNVARDIGGYRKGVYVLPFEGE